MLFDALYAETDKYVDWIKADPLHRFVNLYTDHGGTLEESKAMYKLVGEADVDSFEVEETALAPPQLFTHRIIFIHTLKEHNDIVGPDNFRLMLENEPFLRKL